MATEASRRDLPTGAMTRVIESLARMSRAGGSPEANKPILVFSGGEPLLRGDWVDLGRHAVRCGLAIALATNGTLVDADMAELIRQTGFARVSVSLDGADAATHDVFRGSSGSFEAAVAGARRLRAAGVELQINSTVARHNLHQLEALHALAAGLEAAALHLFLLVPVGCGRRSPNRTASGPTNTRACWGGSTTSSRPAR